MIVPRPIPAQRPAGPSRRTLLGWATVGIGAAALGPASARADSASLPDLVARARASVVPVGTFSPTDNPRFGFRGSGFVVGDGLSVITNFHVIPQAAEAEPGRSLMVLARRDGGDPEPRPARLAATDRAHDLALLRIDGEPLHALALADDELAREGTPIALIGFPIGGLFGFSPVTHRGIVASVTRIALPAPTSRQLDARAVAQLRDGAFEIYQLDATAYPGNSGGPVFDAQTGRVIGVLNMVLVRGTRESALSNPTGISYAIPVRWVRELMREK